MHLQNRRARLILLRLSGERSLARGMEIPHFSATMRSDSGNSQRSISHHEAEDVPTLPHPKQ